MTWVRCDNQPAQIWFIEQHRRNEYDEWWEHVHPFVNERLCLQPSSQGGAGTAITVEACGADWLQRWKLASH